MTLSRDEALRMVSAPEADLELAGFVGCLYSWPYSGNGLYPMPERAVAMREVRFG
jgi:hypothetical protein